MQSLFGEPKVPRIVASNVAPKQPPILVYSNWGRGSGPGSGLLYSVLLHEIIIFGLLFLSATQPPPRVAHTTELVAVFDLSQPPEPLFLPALGGGGGGGSGPAKRGPGTPQKASSATLAAGRKGFSYPGPQVIISNPPRPTNRIQTILQPGLPNPPSVKVPIALPNIVRMAEAGPAPLVAPPTLPPPVFAQAQPPAPSPVSAPAPFVPVLPKVEPPKAVPAEPPKLALPAVTVPSPAFPAQPRPPEPVPKPAQEPAPPVVSPPHLSTLPTHGTDSQNLLSLSPIPAQPQSSVKVPVGEARGQFAISPEPNLEPSASAPDLRVEKSGSTAVGTGNKSGLPGASVAAVGGNGSGGGGTSAGEGKGSGAGRRSGPGSGAGTGNGSGTGAGAGNGTGAGTGEGGGTGAGSTPNAFPGITIQGGSMAGGSLTAGGRTGAPLPPQTSYGMTIIATGSSGGGLPDFGVFFDEQVYTVYINMRRTADDTAPSWVLQYSVLHGSAAPPALGAKSGEIQLGLVPPFPVFKVTPSLPVELVARYWPRTMVVYAVINPQGRLERMHILETPSAEFNQPLLDALAKWVFRPAELNGAPVSLKALFGIPLWLPD